MLNFWSFKQQPTIELEQAPTKLQPIAAIPQPTTKKLKPLIRLKHSHQTHAFHKSLTFQKKLKTPTTNNKAPMNCTRTLMTFNSALTYNKTSLTSDQTHISHKFFLPLSKHFDEQQQSFDKPSFTFHKMFKSLMTSNKAPMNCTKVLTTNNTA